MELEENFARRNTIIQIRFKKKGSIKREGKNIH